MENVPGIAAVPGFSSDRRFLKTPRDCGYARDPGVLNPCDFGVPQHRGRHVLLAARGSTANLPSPAGPGSNAVTARAAIGRFPAIDGGDGTSSIPNHYAARLSERNLQRIRATSPDGGLAGAAYA